MSGYLSNLLTQTTSRYNSLRRTLLQNEDDGDTEDDSHISRVLRAYYTEKARPFPSWLPPDPNDRRAAALPSQQQQPGYHTTQPPMRGQLGVLQRQHNTGSSSSLSDLWDTPGQGAAGQAGAPQSLRAGRRVPGGARPESSSSSHLAPPTQARPLPSQREGSWQSVNSNRSFGEPSPPATAGSGGAAGTAQERLKARLWGAARSASPVGSPSYTGSQNPFDQQGSMGGQQQEGGAGGGNSRRYGRIS